MVVVECKIGLSPMTCLNPSPSRAGADVCFYRSGLSATRLPAPESTQSRIGNAAAPRQASTRGLAWRVATPGGSFRRNTQSVLG